jgi:hypothetical protein
VGTSDEAPSDSGVNISLDICPAFRYRTLARRSEPVRETGRHAFSGRAFTPDEIALMREVVETCAGLTRCELAHTLSELLGWTRPGGALKARECREFLERLEGAGVLTLPAKHQTKPLGTKTTVPHTERGDPGPVVTGRADAFAPVRVEPVARPDERLLFRELVGRHHALGYAVPYGAHIQYLVSVSRPAPTVVGGLQFSSAAWRLRARDGWIGWDDRTRARHLTRIVANSRLLVLPWVHVANLVSTTLRVALRRLPQDWQARYGVEPLLVETFVDPARYTGGCYRASNWVALGDTAGRGRDDRTHQRHGAHPKRVWVYPLRRDARAQLRGEA